MKYARVVMIMYFLVFVVGCRKESEPSSKASMSVLKSANIEFDEFKVKLIGVDTLQLELINFSKADNSSIMMVTFTNCPLRLGNHQILSTINSSAASCKAQINLVDVDAIVSSYEICKMDSLDNFITFNEINASDSHLKGVYRCIFVRDTLQPKYFVDLPDTLRVNGMFDLNQNWIY